MLYSSYRDNDAIFTSIDNNHNIAADNYYNFLQLVT